MYNTIVTLKKGEGRTLKAGGMWVFDNEIASIMGDFENGDIPPSYYCQCMHYMAVTGFEKWYIAVLVMGKGFFWYEINRNEEEIEALIKAEGDFWEMVKQGNAPDVDGSESTKNTLNTRWQSQVKSCVLGHEAEDSVKELLSIKKRIKAFLSRNRTDTRR